MADMYRYPDPGERVTTAIIGRSGIADVWGEQEQTVLAGIDELLRSGPRGSLLDYGSGLGRLSLRYAATFDRVTSFEPDPSRAAEQRAILATAPGAERIRLIEEIRHADHGYDAVLCSHVIQHVPHAVASRVLGEVAARVGPGGAAIVLTTLSSDAEPCYVLNYIDTDGEPVEQEVALDAFERAFAAPAAGVLPVRFFTFAGLVDELRRWDLDTLAAFGFHGTHGVVGPTTEATPDLLRCRDIAVVARRR
jgi:SAM-dependent methyltransferase